MTLEARARPSNQAVVRRAEGPEGGAWLIDADPVSLVLAARNGSRAAWEELVDRFTPLLWFVARRRGLDREDAADAVQMTWLRCVERLDQVRDPDSIAAWLMAICRRESLAIVRRHARARSEPIADDATIADPFGTDAAETLIKREEREILSETISRLPDRQRRVLLALLDADEGSGDGYREIARQLGLPAGSIGPTRQRALQRLRTDPKLQNLRRPTPKG